MCASSGAFRDTASSVTINHEERSPSEGQSPSAPCIRNQKCLSPLSLSDGGVSDWRQALLSNFTEDELMLGKLTPKWVPDTEASACMICDLRFTLVKRRHHCRYFEGFELLHVLSCLAPKFLQILGLVVESFAADAAANEHTYRAWNTNTYVCASLARSPWTGKLTRSAMRYSSVT